MPTLTAEQYKKPLVSLGVIAEKDFDALVAEAAKASVPFDQYMLQKEMISDTRMGEVTAELLGVPFVKVSSLVIPDEVFSIIPEPVARKQQAIAYERTPDVVRVAMSDPGQLEFVRNLEKKTGERVEVAYATAKDISGVLGRYKKELKQAFDEMIQSVIQSAGTAYQPEDLPIIKIVETIMLYGYDNGASDVHIEPQEKATVVRFRIDGILHDVISIPKQLHDLITSRIKILAKLKIDEHRAAQDGKFQFETGEERVDARVSITPVVEGEKVVIRLLAGKLRQHSLNTLGFSESDLKKVTDAMNRPFGMILVTGPTGSGKTTTLYAILKILNEREVNIATIEDPVEYEIAGINQIQVNPDTNLTFAEGLKSIVRQDPDIVMVGEIRDNETAAIAVNAALTGHLVLSTLHTNDSATAVPRLIDMKVEPFLLASTINIVIAQRLVRRICSNCIQSYVLKADDATTEIPLAIKEVLFQGKSSVRLSKGKGCNVCHFRGLSGRVGIYEILAVTDEIRELIMQRANADIIRKEAIRLGMNTMFLDGISKVVTGQTTLDEVMKEMII